MWWIFIWKCYRKIIICSDKGYIKLVDKNINLVTFIQKNQLNKNTTYEKNILKNTYRFEYMNNIFKKNNIQICLNLLKITSIIYIFIKI